MASGPAPDHGRGRPAEPAERRELPVRAPRGPDFFPSAPPSLRRVPDRADLRPLRPAPVEPSDLALPGGATPPEEVGELDVEPGELRRARVAAVVAQGNRSAGNGQSPESTAERDGEVHPASRFVERFMVPVARFGWVAKGMVFVLIGLIAVNVVFPILGPGGDAEADHEGALAELAEQPLGRALLGLLAIGLALFTAWQLIQVFLPNRFELHPAGLVNRAVWLGLAVFYGMLTFIAAERALSPAPEADNGDNDTDVESITALAMEFPLGRWAVGAVALGILGVGGYNVYKGATRGFLGGIRYEDPHPAKKAALIGFGTVGFIARGVGLALVGWFVLQSAIRYDPDEAAGLDESLQQVQDTTFGPALIVLTGLGFIAAGAYDALTFRRQHVA